MKKIVLNLRQNVLLIFCLIVVVNLSVSGTDQMPDRIIYNGKVYLLKGKSIFDECYPMESYFENYPDKRPKVKEQLSNLWRNYIATYEIKDDQLYLKDIEFFFDSDSEIKSVYNEIFPNQELIKIDWLTRLIVIPDGKRNGFYDYERYIVLEINEGNFIREKQIILNIDENFMKEWQYGKITEYELFKKRQYEAFKETDEYDKVIEKLNDQTQNANLDYYAEHIELYVFKYSSKILVE